jgi:large subunit ribosomal protein L24
MKNFSKKWISSKNPSKQRKYLDKAPIHIKRKFLSVNLSKELRKKYEKRNVVVRKNDVVKIMRGKFKGKRGKVIVVKTKRQRIEIEGIQMKKQDGSKSNVPIKPSNLQIVELNLEDGKRGKKFEKKAETKKEKITEPKESVKKSSKTFDAGTKSQVSKKEEFKTKKETHDKGVKNNASEKTKDTK